MGKSKLKSFLKFITKEGPTAFADPLALVGGAIESQVAWAKWEGQETEDELRLRLRAHWPTAVSANIDAAIERRYHPERRN